MYWGRPMSSNHWPTSTSSQPGRPTSYEKEWLKKGCVHKFIFTGCLHALEKVLCKFWNLREGLSIEPWGAIISRTRRAKYRTAAITPTLVCEESCFLLFLFFSSLTYIIFCNDGRSGSVTSRESTEHRRRRGKRRSHGRTWQFFFKLITAFLATRRLGLWLRYR